MPFMAKQQPQSEPKKDRHLNPKKTIRLPKEVGQALDDLAEKEDRTITTIVLRALRLYAKENNYPWPGSS